MLVVFVCLHGAGKSRVAAALFNAAAPPGWRATSAGVTPQDAPSPHPASLLAGTAAARWVDDSMPRAMLDTPADLTVAIDCATPADRRWDLEHEWPDPRVADELRTLTAELARGL
ncbi:hypothetical protein [Allorhizocola rhizosphaerae]|uniref:hypothetical protein n=1 Tax=Allorhizocola rhizosphaerae TaxID=1872709 RepID=UPI000E3C3F5A|nr:hypothetical protein [Allorhizocola rhizosphaerae]